MVARQANHMARLLDDLLDVSRITRGRIVLGRVASISATRHAWRIEALGPLHGRARHAPDRPTSATEPVPVFGDPSRLQQVQANLLSNASNYSPVGGPRPVRASPRARTRRSSGSATRRGIEPRAPAADLRSVRPGPSHAGSLAGRPRHRPDAAAVAGRTARRTRRADSAGPARGSVFMVRLPLEAPTAQPAADDACWTTGRTVRTVVLVEDQPDARRMPQLLLESRGRQVPAAENGADGPASDRTHGAGSGARRSRPSGDERLELARRCARPPPVRRRAWSPSAATGRIQTSRRRSTPASTST